MPRMRSIRYRRMPICLRLNTPSRCTMARIIRCRIRLQMKAVPVLLMVPAVIFTTAAQPVHVTVPV